MNEPLISVIIPTYNRGEALHTAIRSVLEQTHKNMDIIVVDDNSIDPVAPNIKAAFPSEHITVLRNDSNFGNAKSRNVGLEQANGEYIAFLDDDDIWFPTKLQKQVAVIESLGADGCFCGTIWVEDGKETRKTLAINPDVSFENGGPTSTWLLKKSVFDKVGRFDESFPANVDGEFLVRFNKSCVSSFVKEYLYVHYYYPEQITASVRKKVRGFQRMLDKHKDILNSAELSVGYAKLAIFSLFAGHKEVDYLRTALRYKWSLRTFLLGIIFFLPAPIVIKIMNFALDLQGYPKSYIGRYAKTAS